jgi:diaminopimelate decarboxylase
MIPSEFYSIIGRDDLRQRVLATQTPAYILFGSIIREQLGRLRSTLGPRFSVNYAMKANPHADVLSLMRELDVGIDIASGGELSRAIAAGFDPSRIEFSGPGKSVDELQLAVASDIGCINVESLEEIEILEELSSKTDSPVAVGIRVNPDLDSRAGLRMGASPQFGVPEQDQEKALAMLTRSHKLDFVGISMHVGSQILEAPAVVEIFRAGLDIARSVFDRTGRPIRKINFGGGWGVTYFAGQSGLDLSAVESGLAELMESDRYQPAIATADLIVEPGRFLVAESGVYSARVLYRKRSGGQEIAVIDGGLNSNYVLAGGMGQVIRRNFLFDSFSAHPKSKPKGKMTIAGCLCTPQDILAQNAELDCDLHTGDRLVFFNCGAYGATASPSRFLSHSEVYETLVES